MSSNDSGKIKDINVKIQCYISLKRGKQQEILIKKLNKVHDNLKKEIHKLRHGVNKHWKYLAFGEKNQQVSERLKLEVENPVNNE